MIKQSVKWVFLLGAFVGGQFGTATELSANTNVKRYALIVGKNWGGKGRPSLKFAGRDARAVYDTLLQFGGVSASEAKLSLEPGIEQVKRDLSLIHLQIQEAKKRGERAEFFFYYSGHSDERGLLLGSSHLFYPELKRTIAKIPAEVHVVILDSCASGVFAQLKGGKMRAPFITHAAHQLKGSVVLTATSDREPAQESDRVQGSYFTHYLLSGIRGAGDLNRDSLITLNEAYQYAFHQTLGRTEDSRSGPQHPSYSIDLEGRGELVITDLRTSKSNLVFGKDTVGRFFVRDEIGRLVAEVDKSMVTPVLIGVDEGGYTVTQVNDGVTRQLKRSIGGGESVFLASTDFSAVMGESNVRKGEVSSDLETETYTVPLEVSVFRGVTTNLYEQERTRNHFHLSLLDGRSGAVSGVGLSLLGINTTVGRVQGLSLSPFGNILHGNLEGLQLSAGWNEAKQVRGVQLGLLNRSTELRGSQLGGFSQAEDVVGLQTAVLTRAEEVVGIQVGMAAAVTQTLMGLQVGGVSYAEELSGTQLGGFNLASEMQGLQAGIVNVSSDGAGVQVGAVNVSQNHRGLQLGVVNWNGGEDALPIGLINVGKGYRFRMGYSLGERNSHTIHIRNGSRVTYSLFQFTNRRWLDPQSRQNILGAGLGAQFLQTRWAYFGLESALNWVDQVSSGDSDFGVRIDARLTAGFRFTEWISVGSSLGVAQYLNNVFEFPYHLKPVERTPVTYLVGMEVWL